MTGSRWSLRPRARLQGWLTSLIGLGMVAIVAADVANLLAAHDRAIDTAQAETANLSRSLADQAHGVFQSMDTILVGLRERVETDGTGQAALARLQGLLRLRVQALPMIERLMVVDAAGRVIVAAGPPAARAAPGNIGGWRIFGQHAGDPDRAAFLGWPVRETAGAPMVLTVSRRVDGADGRFAGLVIASVGTAFFRQAYAGFNTGQHGVILLARTDAVSMARWPADPRGEARDISKSQLFSGIVRPGDHADFQYTSQADGILHLSSYQRVPGEPALVLVGRGRREVLAAWRLTAATHALGLLVVLGVLALLGRRLARELGEVERAQAVLRDTNHRLARSEETLRRANAWMEMAEQISQVGHWHASLADAKPGSASVSNPGSASVSKPGSASGARDIVWSDELFRIHGVAKESFLISLDNSIAAYHPQDRAFVRAVIEAGLRAGSPYEFTARVVRPDGSMRHVLNRGLPEVDAHGVVIGAFGVMMDVTEQKRSEAALQAAHADAEAANKALEAANHALEMLALQDGLTGLANRRCFDRALELAFRREGRTASPLALIMIDVDHFKQFNDLYGHQAGDACLRRIAGVIPPLLKRPDDTAARYGGEEIAVLLPGNTEAGALALAHCIADAVRTLAIPHAGSAHGVVTISAGIEACLARAGSEPAADLVKHADLALYAAKRAGRDSVFTFADWQFGFATSIGA